MLWSTGSAGAGLVEAGVEAGAIFLVPQVQSFLALPHLPPHLQPPVFGEVMGVFQDVTELVWQLAVMEY